MVGGMSKSGEPRRGQALRTKGSSPLTKPQPPAEALQMARILGDHSPPDISDKVQQVRAVVPGRSEEEICIALHDNDFDPEKAISALLDSEAVGEWTTRKERKKKRQEIDLVIGETKLRQAGVRTLGTTKTAPSREVGRRAQTSARVRSSRGRMKRNEGGLLQRGSRVRTKPPPASSQNEPGSTDHGVIIESWDIDVAEPPQQHIDTESWGDDPLTSTDHWEHHVQPELVQRWDSPMFPEALPTAHQFMPVSSTAETTSTATTTSPDRYQSTPFVLELKPPSKVTRNKHKRIARSEIPTKPVEMPGSIDALDVEFGSLGIDFFVGAEREPPESEITPPAAISTSTGLEAITTTTKLEDVTPLLTVQHFTDDPGVIGATLDPYPETKAPPGLTHPSENQEKPPLLPEPISLPPHSESTMPTLSAASLPMPSHSLPPIPQSIELPRPTPETLTDSVTTVEQPIFTPVASTTTSLLFTATQTHTSPTTLTASTGTRASQSQHTGQQGKHGQPHPNMLAYPMMTPQYFMPMSYYGDPSEMSRYPSVYYQQHPGASSDLSSAAATGITRDHSTMETSKFPGRADVTTPGSANTQQQTQQGGLQQGQQIGPAFVNPAYPYSQMLYPGWYHTAAMGMAGFSAAASMGPKASTSYPGVSTYQATSPGAFGMQAAYDETGGRDFPRMYPSSMPKSSGVPSTSVMSDLSNASFKHQQFDSKTASNYYQMGTSAGGYMGGFMQMPGVPMHHLPVVPPHDNTQTRGQMQKHSKPSYGGLTWPQGT